MSEDIKQQRYSTDLQLWDTVLINHGIIDGLNGR